MARILVVDDSEAVRKAVALTLEDAGYEVCVAAEGNAAKEHLLDPTIDLAVMDIWIPGIDGISLLKEAARTRPDLPVIMISGGGPGASLEAASARADVLGAAAFLFKPFEDSELLDVVARSLG